MKPFSLEEVDPSWVTTFEPLLLPINNILSSLDEETLTPHRNNVFKVFTQPVDSYRVVIVGQDPYPGAGVADGLAFSQSATESVPASLRNIFREYESDLNFPTPTTTDLTSWMKNGVALLNRTLTNEVGATNAHLKKGWSEVTLAVAERLAASDVVAILWGRKAQELATLFPHRIESVHPSPLSARRGFFGSRPFSTANDMLRDLGKPIVDWRLQ